MSSLKTDALVIGNGPSVDRLDAATLQRFYTFGTNHIYKKFDEWGRGTDAVVITDSNRIHEIGNAYRDYPGKLYVGHQDYAAPSYRRLRRKLGRDFIPLRQLVKPKARRLFVLAAGPVPAALHPLVFDKIRFAFDFQKGLNFGYSVVISSIQIAVIEGFRRVCLTGVDASYSKPKDYFSGADGGIQYVNHAFIASPRLWMEPLLVNLQISLEDSGVELIDCTPGGKLRFIIKGSLGQYGAANEHV